MRHSKSYLLIVFTGVILTGCSHRTSIGTDYEFVKPDSISIDSGSTPCAIYYKGQKVWRSVLNGSDETYHDGILVFESTVPRSEGGDNVYPQLFAIHGAGPPVILSERILNQPFNAGSQYVHNSTYQLDTMTPIPNGLRVVFNLGITNDSVGMNVDMRDTMVTNDVSWLEIQSEVHEAETSAPVQIAPLGQYRILPMKRPNAQNPLPD